jgi:hypothetical protein
MYASHRFYIYILLTGSIDTLRTAYISRYYLIFYVITFSDSYNQYTINEFNCRNPTERYDVRKHRLYNFLISCKLIRQS